MAKDPKRAKQLNALRSAHARRGPTEPDPLVTEARQILMDLESAPDSYRLSYYAVEPRWLSDDDLNVPVDGRTHEHASVLGKHLELPESHRRNTIREASNGFQSPFIAVLRNVNTADEPVGEAVIIQGADLSSEMLSTALQIMMRARRQTRLHFAALLGMPAAPGEWAPSSKEEMTEIVDHFTLRVEAEAVLAAAPFVPGVGVSL